MERSCIKSEKPYFPRKNKLLTKYILVFSLAISVCSANRNADHYDFIIAGGGTAGCALARRLAEDGEFTVLVLESGGLPKPDMDIPAYAPSFLRDSDVTFYYNTVPQRNAGLDSKGVMSVFSGRMLSGTSSLNYMWFNRGSPNDYDNWANLTNDESWNYSNMLKYLKRVETYTGDFPSDQHGYQGPITVSRPRYTPGLDYWLAAGKSLGYPIADPNGPQRVSFTPVEYSKRFGRRVSSFTGYIKPIIGIIPNLHIITNANVTQIIFEGKRAVGIKYETRDALQSRTVYAKKEVIISSGTFGSPVLLMRSGVGPRDVLEAANIPCIQELPVGQSLKDHTWFPLNFIVNNKAVVIDAEKDLSPENLALFRRTGDGPFSSTSGSTGQAFIPSSVAIAEGNSDWADLQLIMSHSTQAFHGPSLNRSLSLASWEIPMSSSVWLTRPKSRGSIKINPRNPQGSPLIDFQYLTDPRDMQMALDGIKMIMTIFEKTSPYRKLGARYSAIDIPTCRHLKFRSVEYWKCYVQHLTLTGCHPVGSCRMGAGPHDPNAVVDTKLRVIGIDNLRVVDASIMPDIINANTQVGVYGIAEKAADMILEHWKPSQKYSHLTSFQL